MPASDSHVLQKPEKHWKTLTSNIYILCEQSKAKLQAYLNFMLEGTNWLLVVERIMKFLHVVTS